MLVFLLHLLTGALSGFAFSFWTPPFTTLFHVFTDQVLIHILDQMCVYVSRKEGLPWDQKFAVSYWGKKKVDSKIGVWNAFIYVFWKVFLEIEKCMCL